MEGALVHCVEGVENVSSAIKCPVVLSLRVSIFKVVPCIYALLITVS